MAMTKLMDRTPRQILHFMGRKLGLLPASDGLPQDFDDQTKAIWAKVAGCTMTSPERISALIEACRYVEAHAIPGSIVECGVWRGGSSMAAALALMNCGVESRDLYLFDTFEGMSAPTDVDIMAHGAPAKIRFAQSQTSEDSSDWCASPLDEVRKNIQNTGYPTDKIHFIKGKVEDTIPENAPDEPIAILRLDTDWYESTKHELEHLFPRLSPYGVLIIDDYGYWEGARKAVDEYLEEHRVRILLNRIDDTGRVGVKIP